MTDRVIDQVPGNTRLSGVGDMPGGNPPAGGAGVRPFAGPGPRAQCAVWLIRPKRPALKSLMAVLISAWVFMTKGP
jgi:hypothetical protein